MTEERAKDISLDALDAEYRSRLRDRVQLGASAGASTLTELCRVCAGAFPTSVLEVARQTPGLEAIERWPHRRWRDDALGTEDGAVPSMPEPHPIDYDWRYTAETADALSEYLGRSRRVACFGAPSVFVRLAHAGNDAVLIDRNPGLRRHFDQELHSRMWTMDLTQQAADPYRVAASGGPPEPFDAILLDPPWYVDHIWAWLARALPLLRPNGRLVLTLFPRLVRPSATKERDDLATGLSALGSVRPLTLAAAYTTPLFEQETLSYFGLGDLGQWRHGELIEVAIAEPSNPNISAPPITEPQWDRVQLGRQVIAVRREGSADRRPVSAIPIMDDGSFLLKTVSARDPIRRRATLWTSRNRAAIVTGTERVLAFLKALEAGTPALKALAAVEAGERSAFMTLLALIGW